MTEPEQVAGCIEVRCLKKQQPIIDQILVAKNLIKNIHSGRIEEL